MSSKLLDFYNGGIDDEGRTLDGILGWPDAQLESVHDFIQWLFPLPERSGANPDAPILDAAIIDAFLQSPALQQRLRASFLRMIGFYGLELQDGAIHPAATFPTRSSNWLHPNNHNHLRLTRMLRSLRLLGLVSESDALFAALSKIYREYPSSITARTYQFWEHAAEIRR